MPRRRIYCRETARISLIRQDKCSLCTQCIACSAWWPLLLLVGSCLQHQATHLSSAARHPTAACSAEQVQRCNLSGATCVAGVCVLHPQGSSDLASSILCNSSTVCRESTPAAPYCVRGRCAAKCTANSQCEGPNAKVCAVDGVCRRQQCTSNNQCRSFNKNTPHCIAGRCRKLQCATDQQCNANAPFCLEGKCRKRQCYADMHCIDKMGAGYSCSAGQCQLGQQTCATDVECDPLKQPYCVNRICQQQQCTSDADCKQLNNGTTPFCIETNSRRECKSCSSDEQCRKQGPATPYCKEVNGQHKCIGCSGDTDCSINHKRTGLACDADQGICVECTSNKHCDYLAVMPGELTCSNLKCVSNSMANASIPCQQTEQCPRYLYGPQQVCHIEGSSGQGSCRECNADKDCPSGLNGVQSACSPSGRCVQCTQDSDCPEDSLHLAVCSVATNKCVECRSDEDCRYAVSPGKALICVHGKCSYCRTDSDCCGTAGLFGLGPYCMSDSICATKGRPCATDEDCVYDRDARCRCKTEPCPSPKCNLEERVCDSGLEGL